MQCILQICLAEQSFMLHLHCIALAHEQNIEQRLNVSGDGGQTTVKAAQPIPMQASAPFTHAVSSPLSLTSRYCFRIAHWYHMCYQTCH